MFKKNGFKLFICAMVATIFLALPFVVYSLNNKDKNAKNADLTEPDPTYKNYTFGAYEQDNNLSNGKEKIEWRILMQDGSKMLLLSDKALDFQPYNVQPYDEDYYIYFDDIDRLNYKQYTTWKECTLRKWLNDDFIDAAFSPEEQKKIQTTYVTPDDNPDFAGIYYKREETMDKVFLLSIDEVEDYFPSSESKKCSATDYAAACGAVITGSSRTDWWLRTQGDGFDKASYVTSVYGWVHTEGTDIRNRRSVRPALWIDLDS